MFRPEDLEFFIEQGRLWASGMHSELWPKGNPLAEPLIQHFAPFFGKATLTRIHVVALKEIPNPPFYQLLAARNIPAPIDFTQMAGITFIDTVIISERKAHPSEASLRSLLFHEAVHVVQYEQIGLDRFMNDYVMGWAENGFDYFAIPLEKQAYALQHRFDENPSAVFSVHDEIG
jgi:Domain of unknown function (DUF4157)